MATIEFQAHHDIKYSTPVRIPVTSEISTQGALLLEPVNGAKPLVAQGDGDAIVAIVSQLPAGQSLQYEVKLLDEINSGIGVKEERERLTLTLPEGEFSSYHFGAGVVRPFFWPLLGPGQTPVTREVRPGVEEADHKHHRSLFTAYEEANGSSNWNEEEGHGFTRHQRFHAIEQGPIFGGFTAEGLWTDKEQRPVLTEMRRLRLYNVGNELRLLDYTVSFIATHGDVEFGETKEAGVLGIRVTPSMNGSAGGIITNSNGGRGESECWGRKAAWCDYSGEVEGKTVGITVFDHPSNPNFPTRWHVRDYGLFATNPFSTAAFNAGDPSPYLLQANDSVKFRYRILIHQGKGENMDLQNLSKAFGKDARCSHHS